MADCESCAVDKLANPRNKTSRLPVVPVTTQRTLAKTGMGISMGVLVWSAMARGRQALRYHTLAGVALLGFTVWHIALYKSRNKTFDE